MFKERQDVKEALKILEESKRLESRAERKMRDFEKKMKRARSIALEELSDESKEHEIWEEIREILKKKKELKYELEEKKRYCLGYRHLPIGKEEEEKYEKRCKELEEEYQMKYNELCRNEDEKRLELEGIQKVKKREKKEICKIFGCDFKGDVCECCGREYRHDEVDRFYGMDINIDI